MTFFSPALRRMTGVRVVLPADHEPATHQHVHPEGTPWRTLYLLGGYMHDRSSLLSHTRVAELANELDLCVVMLDCRNRFYVDSEHTGEAWSTFVSEELIAFTRTVLPLSREREETFLGGISMGGEGTVINVLQHPEVFGGAAVLSSGFKRDIIISNAGDHPLPSFYSKEYFETAFDMDDLREFEGSRFDTDHLAYQVAERAQEGAGERPAFFLCCGTDDEAHPKGLAYHELLLSLGYDSTWWDAPGGHHWDFWASALEPAMRWVASRPQCGGRAG